MQQEDQQNPRQIPIGNDDEQVNDEHGLITPMKQEMMEIKSPLDGSNMMIVSIQLVINDQFFKKHEKLKGNSGKFLIIALERLDIACIQESHWKPDEMKDNITKCAKFFSPCKVFASHADPRDKSAGMEGSGISEAKLALESLLMNVEGTNERILFIPYESHCELIDFSGLSIEKKLRYVREVRASGGTSFESVFNAIRNYDGLLNGQIAIIFFTDGQDFSKSREAAIQSLQKRLNVECESYEFHTIGFTSCHDARLLTAITRLGSAQGTFQYAESSSCISSCVNNLTELVKGISFYCNLIVNNSEGIEIVRERIKLDRDEDSKNTILTMNFNLQAFIENGILSPDYQFYLEFEDEIIPISHESLQRKEPIYAEKLSYQTKLIENCLIEAAGLINKEGTSLKEIHIKCKNVEENLELVTNDIRKMRDKSVRRALYEMIQPIYESLANFNKILAEAMVGTLSNEKIANLNSLAYRSITKRGLQKKLDQRAQGNVELFEKAEEIIQSSVDSMNFEEIKQKYSKQAEEIGPCFYTTCNWIDLLQDKDCLCLGLQVNRPQAAIADPTRVEIISVSTSLISAESFLESATFSLGSAYRVEDSHGGFKDVESSSNGRLSNNQSKIVSGASRESINAVLPLYISEEHWKVARQKIKPILGFIATLDIMGYSFEQYKTIPFLVLNKLLKDSSEVELTEFQSLRFKLVMDTCLQIVKECSAENFEEKMSELLTQLFTRYNSHPEKRTLDVIPNTEVFLTQLLCAHKLGLVDHSSCQVDNKLFFKNIAEEELRRKGAFVLNLPEVSVDLWFELLSVDTEKMIDQYVSRKKEKLLEIINDPSNKQRSTGEIIRQILNVGNNSSNLNNTENVTSQPIVNEDQDLIDYVLDLTQLSPKASELFTKLDVFYNKKIQKGLKKINELINNNSSSTVELELDNAGKILLLTQTIDHQKNANRRYAIQNNTYISPFSSSPVERHEYLRSTIIKHIKNRRTGIYSNFVNGINATGISGLSSSFASTDDIYEAAGIIYGNKRGRGDHMVLFDSLCYNETVPHLAEKLKMLASGEFQGISLFTDKMDNPNWSVLRSFKRSLIFKLWRKHAFKFTIEEWSNLTGLSECYFEKVYSLFKKKRNQIISKQQ